MLSVLSVLVVFQLLIVLGQVVLQVLEKVDKRRRSLPMVLVHLVETAPSSPQSLSRLSLDSEAKVHIVQCAHLALLSSFSFAGLRVKEESSLIKRRQRAAYRQLMPS